MNLAETKGLTTAEAEDLTKRYGLNEIKEETDSKIVRFLKKFIGPIPIMIEIALILSVIAKKWEDFVIIFVLLGVNIMIDFIQEEKSRSILEALRDTLPTTTTVIRDGILTTIDAKKLVPEDIIKLGIGDVVPADVVLIGDAYLSVDQSTITGESLPVNKLGDDTLYSSSIIQRGSGLARVTATGRNSSIGENANLVAQAEDDKESHFQKAILGIAKFLIVISAILISIIFVILILRGDSFIESTRFALVLAIASIPVALPAVLSVTMAIGTSILAKKNAIVSNFRSMEELAGVDVLCVDKTGTLTKNKIAVDSPKTYAGFNIMDLFTYSLLASEIGRKTPIENAIHKYAEDHDLLEKVSSYKLIKFTPFNPTTKLTKAKVKFNTGIYTIIMGAPQIIISHINDDSLSGNISKDVRELGANGFRTLAVAIKKQDKFIPVGLIPLADPARDDSKSVIADIKQKGVQVKMLTGDNTEVATFMARILDIGTRIVSSPTLRKTYSTKDDGDDLAVINNADVFTEVVPEDKYRIVDVLQKNGHIVAMTGDGVNDAPALKKADIGIAVSGASPAARSAAGMVLLDNSLGVIKDAIYYARIVFSRMQAYATFRIAETIRIVFFITLSLIIFNYSPLSAVMVIMLALLNDIPVMSIAYDNAPVHENPIRWHMNETLIISTVLGIVGLISSFALFYWLNVSGYSILLIQTLLFLKLDVAGHSTLYITRTGRKHFWEKPFPSLKFFIPAFSSRIIGTIIAVYGIFMEPISWQAVMYIWIYSTVWFLFNDQIKVLTYKILDRYRESKERIKYYKKSPYDTSPA